MDSGRQHPKPRPIGASPGPLAPSAGGPLPPVPLGANAGLPAAYPAAYPAGPAPGKPGFSTGLRCLFGGFGFLLRTSASWPLAAVPLLVAIVLGVVSAWSAIAFVPSLIEWLLGAPAGTWTAVGLWVLKLLATIVALVVGLLLSVGLAQPLSGPALEALVRLQQRQLGAPPRPPTGFFLDMWRSLKSVLIGYVVGLPLLAICFVVSFFFPMAAIVTTPLQVVITAFMIAWDLCDYPLSVHGLKVGQRVRVVARYWPSVLGFSLALALCSFIPCLLFLFLPAGVAGAARLMWHVERWERGQGIHADWT